MADTAGGPTAQGLNKVGLYQNGTLNLDMADIPSRIAAPSHLISSLLLHKISGDHIGHHDTTATVIRAF
jgi:hypothetical protein